MTKVLDNFHSPPMVMAPWLDYGNYPTLESLIEKNNTRFHKNNEKNDTLSNHLASRTIVTS